MDNNRIVRLRIFNPFGHRNCDIGDESNLVNNDGDKEDEDG